jgi:Mn-dependent DtxR family transcriptional regulator
VQTQAVEDYLKAIYELQAGQKQVSTTALSERRWPWRRLQ